MAFEQPPLLTGDNRKDLANLRDYLFRIARSLNPVTGAGENTKIVGYNTAGQAVQKAESPGGGADIENIRRNANELRDLILKTAKGVNIEIENRISGDAAIQGNLTVEIQARTSGDTALQQSLTDEAAARTSGDTAIQQSLTEEIASRADGDTGILNSLAAEIAARIQSDNGVISYADRKVEEYGSMFVAKSEYGQFVEGITGTIETTARGVVDSYNYASAIQSVQDGVDLLQSYYTTMSSEIRRGIVQDPSTGNYVTGIAISQNLQFSGECGPSDTNNPGDGYTYYYLTEGQTFGLYTSTGWQFWIDGVKVGWFDSQDGMLHVGTVYVENRIVNGGYWEEKTQSINGKYMYVINYIGG